ncbi:hypothetical protein AAFF_G00028650 [Aldrovandia affinis]|uniref:Uncharacterized protein n=1 Tax=Aldrovandia affinis TaxID=143900 RepID=A0AAD7WGD4_9TELE|nr:hypothetical protein AAFF_G00028650 [Aldrovandia affinis]
MVEREFRGLFREHGIWSQDPEVCKEVRCHGDDPKQEERQERSARKFQKRALCHDEEDETDSCQPSAEDFPMLPCPSQPMNSRVSPRVAATWPSSPSPNSVGVLQM